MSKLVIALSLLGAVARGATTQEVWNHHIAAWNARDVDGIVSEYADEAVVLVRDHRYVGKKEIAGLFRSLFTLFDRAEEHVIDPATVVGKLVYITWHARIDGVSHPLGTDTFVIENGRITYQTITSDATLFGRRP